MLTSIFLVLGIAIMIVSIFFTAIQGAQIAVIGAGFVAVAAVLELRKLNAHFAARRNRESDKNT